MLQIKHLELEESSPACSRKMRAGVGRPGLSLGPGTKNEPSDCVTSNPCLIPGPLQTEEYARAVVSAGRLYRTERVEELVSLRMRRQLVLHQNESSECVFVIDESALHRPVGGHAVMDRQLSRLLEAAELPQVRLHILPLEVGAHASMGGGFVIAELPGSDNLLCLDNAARGQIADYPEWMRLVQRKWEHLLGEALSERASIDVINKLKVTP
ncbi:DUF5753 domain-containing protein [Salinispora pacifica]|uniref:DUF5753 domain-containing protein n=1 Tax=Salinispora pacifica TaxID=351187 RepID=UPI001E50D318|nr:DUF5753 domain-containing protein [Salinispora pacifica]